MNTAHSVCVPPAALLFHGQRPMVPSPFRAEPTSDQISQIRIFYPLDPSEGAWALLCHSRLLLSGI
jgi:hypothetical protein